MYRIIRAILPKKKISCNTIAEALEFAYMNQHRYVYATILNSRFRDGYIQHPAMDNLYVIGKK